MSEVTVHHFNHGIEIKDAHTDQAAWTKARAQAKKQGIDPESLKCGGITTFVSSDLFRARQGN